MSDLWETELSLRQQIKLLYHTFSFFESVFRYIVTKCFPHKESLVVVLVMDFFGR
jgi:hypothetical protein